MTPAGLQLDQVSIRLGSRVLLEIDCVIAPGEVLTVTGASGAGKSTLIRAIAGFLPDGFHCEGRILLDGADISGEPAEHRHVGVLFQDPLLFPHFSVAENLLFALPPGGSRAQRLKQICALLEPVGLGDLLHRDPATLSGGQQARVALMRVLAAEPKALLLDEPFSKLDPELRDSVRRFVFGLVRARSLPTLLVTHDNQDAQAAGGETVVL